MEVRLLEKGYKTNEAFYQDFLEDKINTKDEYFSNEVVYIKEAPDFPIYMGKGDEEEKRQNFLKAFHVISQSYLKTERDLLLDETFWHSLLVAHKREFILNHYPEVKEGRSKFYNIVLKKFDWENYIYKSILGAQYINDNTNNEDERERYYELIIENLDLYNYIIKYEIFRNDKFLINILDIIDYLKLSKVLKAKIKGREDLGDDERYGRRVIFEFNKSYPVVMAPMLEKEELKKLFITYLSYYYDISQVISEEDFGDENTREIEEDDDFNRVNSDFFVKNMDSDKLRKEESGELEGQSSILVKKINDEKEEIDSESKDELLTYLGKHELEYIDHRGKGGSLWVIGGKSIEAYLKPLEDEGIHFRYKPVGGRASKHRSAWYWHG
ncbi:hypothetical protein [Oceanobacillus zhaokaii]|uniref:hypothetical protein n=1 Tax=Oceanobacillus zhaokaii TaxID=2052660 RepID=UPI001963D91C|nr:hypothetical protein [Oceanobacillus zhaokaii]